MDKKRKIAIVTSLAILGIALVLYFAIGHRQSRYGKLNNLSDAKIFVEYANANHISMEVFFPLQDEISIPGTYELERESSKGKWKTMKKIYSSDTDDIEDTTVLKESIYDASEEPPKDEKYKNIGFGTVLFDLIDRYDSLDAGTYRVIFPVKKNHQRYDLSAEFTIDRKYEYTVEPENSIAMTTSQLALITEYEACVSSGKYVTYGDFPLGFQNHMFSRDMYTHLSGIELSFEGKNKPVAQKDQKGVYEYLASAILSRQGKIVYGSTLFSNMDNLSYSPLRSGQKDDASEKVLGLSLTFVYDGKNKEITCTINGHHLKVETKDFFFDEEVSVFPLGDPELTPEAHKNTGIFADFYVYNELYEKMMEVFKD